MKGKKVIIVGACIPSVSGIAMSTRELKEEGFNPVMLGKESPDENDIALLKARSVPTKITNIHIPEVIEVIAPKLKNKREKKYLNHY